MVVCVRAVWCEAAVLGRRYRRCVMRAEVM